MNLQVDGIAPLINRLEKFDKDVSKELKSKMRKATTPFLREARSSYPDTGLRNWGAWIDAERGRNLGYSGSQVRASVKLQTTRKRVRAATTAFGYTVVQMNPGGAIIEHAGLKSPTNAFNRAIIGKYGMARKAPRFITRAYYAVAPQLRSEIESYIQDAMRKVGM